MRAFLASSFNIASCQADGDTLFLFNYRSDRMREISAVLGQLDKPVEVDIPKDLVKLPLMHRSFMLGSEDPDST